MDPLSPILTVLSAMITPVVLISACASLILSTSNRLNRVGDRLYAWSDEFEALAQEPPESAATRERRAMIFEQLDLQTSRARLLQRSLSTCHVALGLFVGTSVAIGIVGVAGMLGYGWQLFTVLPIALSLIGAGYLFYGSYLLVTEARLALRAADREMDFMWRQGQRLAPAELLEWRAHRRAGRRWFNLRMRTTEDES
jgi:hypothetical protein